MIYCPGSGSWLDSDEHKWEEKERVSFNIGMPDDRLYFSLQFCIQCGECRKVEYKAEKE